MHTHLFKPCHFLVTKYSNIGIFGGHSFPPPQSAVASVIAPAFQQWPLFLFPLLSIYFKLRCRSKKFNTKIHI